MLTKHEERGRKDEREAEGDKCASSPQPKFMSCLITTGNFSCLSFRLSICHRRNGQFVTFVYIVVHQI